MIYLVEFVIDNDCREDEHIATVKAENTGEAIFKFNKYIDSQLKYDEVVTKSIFTTLTADDVLYCSYK